MRRRDRSSHTGHVTDHDAAGAAPRVAIVTGGSGGTGRQIVQRLAAGGHAVVVGYLRDQVAAEAVVDEVLARRGSALAIRGDVADALDVDRLFTETARAFGGVDVVVHTVPGGPMDVNRAAAQAVRDGGAIVNVACATRDRALSTSVAAPSSGALIVAITSLLARRLAGRRISVNAVVGGGPQAPARPIADAVAYLVSAEGHGVTGQVIEVPADPR
jgi:3-oxoacyl-[acyl-carrier protein] reductase